MSGLTRRELVEGRPAPPCRRRWPDRPAPRRPKKRELIVAQGGDISKFDPHFSTSANDQSGSRSTCSTNLIVRHPDTKLHPSLATDWKLATSHHVDVSSCAQGCEVAQTAIRFSSADVKHSFERTPGTPKQKHAA